MIPKKVEELDNKLKESDALVFSIPEYTGHYSVGFKNLMDWLVVKAYYNADLGQKYSISNKPVYVITFTPAKKGTGDRHFDMTKELPLFNVCKSFSWFLRVARAKTIWGAVYIPSPPLWNKLASYAAWDRVKGTYGPDILLTTDNLIVFLGVE